MHLPLHITHHVVHVIVVHFLLTHPSEQVNDLADFSNMLTPLQKYQKLDKPFTVGVGKIEPLYPLVCTRGGERSMVGSVDIAIGLHWFWLLR